MGVTRFVGCWALVGVAWAGCGDSTPKFNVPGDDGGALVQSAVVCTGLPIEGCGESCGAGTSGFCASGLYCGDDGVCRADCHFGGDPSECGDGKICAFNGRCATANAGGDAGTNVCASVKLDTTRTIPNIMILLDRSGSMNDTFDKDPVTNVSRTKWEALRDLLIGQKSERPSGVIYDFQNAARIGLTMYDGQSSGAYSTDSQSSDPYLTSCVRLVKTPIASTNYSAIVASYAPAKNAPGPSGSTPTGPSIHLLAPQLPIPQLGGDPTILVLATDGSPNDCRFPKPDSAQSTEIKTAVVDEVERICGTKQENCPAGVRTYVIGVATTASTNAHLQQIANVGIGRDRDLAESDPAAAPKFIANDGAEFMNQINGIIGRAVSCDLKLSNRVDPSQACSGTVTLDGKSLACDSDNGWRINADGTGFSLTGTACDDLKKATNPKVEGEFPCGAVQVI